MIASNVNVFKFTPCQYAVESMRTVSNFKLIHANRSQQSCLERVRPARTALRVRDPLMVSDCRTPVSAHAAAGPFGMAARGGRSCCVPGPTCRHFPLVVAAGRAFGTDRRHPRRCDGGGSRREAGTMCRRPVMAGGRPAASAEPRASTSFRVLGALEGADPSSATRTLCLRQRPRQACRPCGA